jgi:predicted transcriptional regulator
MSRTYSDKFLIAMNQADPYRAGVALAKACVKANLPAKYVAVALGVTRMTVYSWFRGKPIRDKNQRVVEAFTAIVEGDIDRELLPAKSNLEARQYIESVLGEPLKM